MRRLGIIIGVLAVLYTGFWVSARIGLGRGLDNGEAAAQAQGIALSYGARDVSGFPSRLDTTYRDLELSAPGWTYKSPLVQGFALAYRPTHLIFYAPGPHVFDGPAGQATLRSADLRASLRGRAALPVPLSEARLTGTDLRFDAPAGAMRAATMLAALREVRDAPGTYDAFGSLDMLELPGVLTGPLEEVRMDMRLRLSAPITSAMDPAMLDDLTLRGLSFANGDSRVTITGQITPDAMGRLDGTVRLEGQNWEPLFDLLPADQTARIKPLLQNATKDGVLTLILTLRAGTVYFGPFPVMELPAIGYRQ